MAYLQNLSTELIVSILSHVSNIRTLYNLSLVSKDLHILTESFLYQKYENTGRGPEDFRHFLPFLRTIVRSPSLAQHVKCVALRGWETDEIVALRGYSDMRALQLCEEDLQLYIDAIKRLKAPEEAGWISAISESRDGFPSEYRDEDAFVALLLSQLSNLEELQLSEVPYLSSRTWSVADLAGQKQCQSSFNELHPLSNLRKLQVRSNDSKYGFNIEDIWPLLRLPSLRTFDALRCQWDERVWERSPNNSLMHTIILEQCAFTAKALELLVAPCKALKVFRFSHGQLHANNITPFTAKQAIEILQPHQSTIEDLKLDLDEEWEVWPKQGWESYQISDTMVNTLSNFQNLVSLEAGQQSLLGIHYLKLDTTSPESVRRLTEILPPSLEYLSLLFCDMRIEASLFELAIVRESKFPHLLTMRIEMARGMLNKSILSQIFPGVDIRISEYHCGADLYPSLHSLVRLH